MYAILLPACMCLTSLATSIQDDVEERLAHLKLLRTLDEASGRVLSQKGHRYSGQLGSSSSLDEIMDLATSSTIQRHALRSLRDLVRLEIVDPASLAPYLDRLALLAAGASYEAFLAGEVIWLSEYKSLRDLGPDVRLDALKQALDLDRVPESFRAFRLAHVIQCVLTSEHMESLGAIRVHNLLSKAVSRSRATNERRLVRETVLKINVLKQLLSVPESRHVDVLVQSFAATSSVSLKSFLIDKLEEAGAVDALKQISSSELPASLRERAKEAWHILEGLPYAIYR